MSYRIAVDVGGTFTDVVAADSTGRITFAKAPSTPADQTVGTLDAIARLSEALGLGVADLLGQTERIVHGMTVATNALLERKGAKVGLLTTEGHRDVLEMREGLKPERYNMRLPRQEPLVPRHLRIGVRERVRANGRVEVPLDRSSLDNALSTLKDEGRHIRSRLLSACVSRRCPRAANAPCRRGGHTWRLRLAVIRGAAADQGVRARLDHGRQCLRRAADRTLPRPAGV